MAIETPAPTDTPKTAAQSEAAAQPEAPENGVQSEAERPRILGLRCRGCGRLQPIAPEYVCGACFGPLEVAYDYDVAGANLTRERIAARPAGIWRYQELLPLDAPPARSLAVGSTPLREAPRLGAALDIGRLWLKDDTRNPTLSFKDRVVAVAAARAVAFGFDTLCCASTGNLAGATAAAAAALGLRAFVFIPADLEPAKIDHALAYGATVVPIAGTYDDVNRLAVQIADEEGWAFVNVNLRPFYAEGSKTLGFEIAEGLGWCLPDVVVAPIASGALFTKVARGFEELARVGLVEAKAVRFVGGQGAGCAPVATAFAAGTETFEPVRQPTTIAKSLAIGNPADGRFALELARRTGGSIEAVEDAAVAAAMRQVASLEGIYPETAGGVTIGAAAQARAAGVIGPEDEVVILLTGNGLKTPDARRVGLTDDGPTVRPGQPGLAPTLQPSLTAFETWLGEGAA
ncbi:MAG TPA: threonine synthase [Candidatus Limnocylindrales bacterium]|nr:threonine synthase [Candidatus Limnocylindrales bacterium]